MINRTIAMLAFILAWAAFAFAQIAPTNLSAELDTLTGEVALNWEMQGSGGTEELIYDQGPTTAGYSYNGYTMSCHMSPAGPCQVLTLKIYTFWDAPDSVFDAEVYDWLGSEPGTTLLHQTPNVVAANSDWTLVDVTGANLFLGDDFMVGFGSINDQCYMGYDAALNNGRSGDYDRTAHTWSSWDEAYIIRAIVQYQTGDIAELEPVPFTPPSSQSATRGARITGYRELLPQVDNTDDFIEFIIYRDDVEIDRTSGNTYLDLLPGAGDYAYYVTSLWDEGESDTSNHVTVSWAGSSVNDGGEFGNPTAFALEAAYPNPFNPTATITYALPVAAQVRLALYDLSGREVAVLVDGWRAVGRHEVIFDGSQLSSGVYNYWLMAGDFRAGGKLVLMK